MAEGLESQSEESDDEDEDSQVHYVPVTVVIICLVILHHALGPVCRGNGPLQWKAKQ